jgi:2-methylaconitate cis-trans-isomerase PrpF
MGMGDVSKLVVPKPVLASRPSAPGGIASRYFTPHACHRSHAATGALAVGTAAALPGSVASRFVDPQGFAGGALRIEHPAGVIPVNLELAGTGEVRRASLVRTARRIFEGNVLVPDSAFA